MLKMDQIELGVCYYPEHWPKTMWREDLMRMKTHGITTIRAAEFSWTLMEPEEGKYDFSFWDSFLTLAQEMKMKVILCTPTAAPPAWLTEKYPECLNADGDGHLVYHGMRRHVNLNSQVYRFLCCRLTEKMAQHFNQYSCVIGWQLDNEINCDTHEYYSDADHRAFREYLKNRFVSLEDLNEKMGTVFWNQTYTDWEQIHLSRRTNAGLNHGNPHLMLEQKRFISQTVIDFIHLQADIVKKYCGDRFITTSGIFADIDYNRLKDTCLDFIGYDSYPNFAWLKKPSDPGAMMDRDWSFNLAKVRAVSSPFINLEQQSGGLAWIFRNQQPDPKPGQMRLWAWQSIAHGADLVSFFRWRTCSVGTEIYCKGLLDWSNQDSCRIRELDRLNVEIGRLNRAVKTAGETNRASIAVITDYDNVWDGEYDICHGPLRERSTDAWFRALERNHIGFDFVDLRDETPIEKLSAYHGLIYPHAAVMTKRRAELLEKFVYAGGRLIVGGRTGYKDEFGRCLMTPAPGYLSKLLGGHVTDFLTGGPCDGEGRIKWRDRIYPAPMPHDLLKPDGGCHIEGYYQEAVHEGYPALLSNALGEGKTWYVGSGFSEELAQDMLSCLDAVPLGQELLEAPYEVELVRRGRILFALNYSAKAMELTFLKPAADILSGEKLNGKKMLEPYGVIAFDTEDVGAGPQEGLRKAEV